MAKFEQASEGVTMRRKDKWPTMKTITIRTRMEPEMQIDSTVTMDGKCIVTIHHDNSFMDDTHYHPAEAERLARALLKAAAVARAKKAAARREGGFRENR